MTFADDPPAPTGTPILSVQDLSVRFVTRKATVHAVNGISYDLHPGETLGIVGESGCGKSVSSMAMLGLLPKTARIPTGTAELEGRDLLAMPERELRDVRGGDIAMIFQDPMTSLNPVLRVGKQITEALKTHLGMDGDEAREEAIRLLERVGIPDPHKRIDEYPHQYSGGMRQRAMIAMAISCRPKVLVADEPTTALDVTIQAQILELLSELVAEERMALILITHDLGVVAGVCERTNVMYAGRFIETGPTDEVFQDPKHPYTVGLLRSVPRLDQGRAQRLMPIGGSPRDLRQEPTSCAFAPRCPKARERCTSSLPPLERMAEDHLAACFYPVTPEEQAHGLTAVQGGGEDDR